MKRVLIATAGLAASISPALGQEAVTYAVNFVEVVAGTNTPVSSPNGLVDLGEGMRIQVSVLITPGIGSPVTYVPPPAPGSGTLAGLGSVFFDLTVTGNTTGTWNNLGRASGWGLGANGTINGQNIDAAQAGQFVLPGSTANSTNPINAIWRGVWTPTSYPAGMDVTFAVHAAIASGGQHSSILIRYGSDPETGDPLYVAKFVGGNFGSYRYAVPAPGTLALLAPGALLLSRRRRGAGR